MKKLTLKEKTELFQGKNKWELNTPEGKKVRTSDGPNGLRIEIGNELGFATSKPAVALPTASLMACSFNPELLYEYGRILGEECIQEGIDILLGPGVNHERSPLGGRNFEYFSEDPVLSGELAAAYINGVQSQNIGTSLKHFAGNSCEKGRLVQNSIIDERALHEIYLRQFEIAVKKGHPWTIMCAYNRLNGTYCTENRKLMDLARSWDPDVAFISDWGAVSDPVKSVKAGLQLQMPGNNGADEILQNALKGGTLTEEELDHDISQTLKLIDRCGHYTRKKYDQKKHLAFAKKAAEESSVLLKNEDQILPLKKEESVALIGPFARKPVYGADGSSRVIPVSQDNLYDALKERNIHFTYAQGFSEDGSGKNEKRILEACEAARNKDKVIIVCALPQGQESEGYDRTSLKLPEDQLETVRRITQINPQVIVILQCGAPVELPFDGHVKGILLMYLAGCQSGKAAADLLYGDVNPCGRLCETWPYRLEDTPCDQTYDKDLHQSEYRESIFTGYRYYDMFHIPVQYPFGYGLSYTSFEWSGLRVENKDDLEITLHVKNTGGRDGRDVIEIYSSMPASRIVRASHELIAFESVFLKAGEEKDIVLHAGSDHLAYYNVQIGQMEIEEGNYTISANRNVSDPVLQTEIYLKGNNRPYSRISMDYFRVENHHLTVSKSDFEKMLGHSVPAKEPVKPFTINTTVGELQACRLGKVIDFFIRHLAGKVAEGVDVEGVMEMPLRQVLWIDRMTWTVAYEIVSYMNHHKWKTLRKMIHDYMHARKKEVPA